jgi:hypothetical protein
MGKGRQGKGGLAGGREGHAKALRREEEMKGERGREIVDRIAVVVERRPER